MAEVSMAGSTIGRLLTLGTMTYESTGWGTGEISIKCRSNTKCEQESLNKAVVTLTASEDVVIKEGLENFVIREMEKKLENKEVKLLTKENKSYNIAKRKFRAWKNQVKSEQSNQ